MQMGIVGAARRWNPGFLLILVRQHHHQEPFGVSIRRLHRLVRTDETGVNPVLPHTARAPIHIVGAPQFDVFRLEKYFRTRKDFLTEQGLDPSRPVVLYCLGSPNLIREDHGALQFLEQMRGPKVNRPDIQVVLRLHPGFKEEGCTELEKIRTKFPDVVIQGPHRHWKKIPYQSTASIVEWVNTIRHADVIVNLLDHGGGRVDLRQAGSELGF